MAPAAAQSPPGPPPLRDPAALGVGWFVGADAWSGGGGPATELRASLGGRLAPGLDGSAWATVEGVADPAATTWIDQHGARLVASTPAGWAGRLAVTGAATGPWLDAALEGGPSARIGRHARLAGWLGGGLRAGGAALGPFGRAELGLDVPAGRLRAHSGLRGTAQGGGLPPIALSAEQWLGTGQRLRLELGLLGLHVPDLGPPGVPGLPVPGAWVAQGLLAASVDLGDRWTARAELGPELARGAASYQRLRAFAGVSSRVGRRPDPAPTPRDGVVRFELRAPEAERVELIAEFDGWAPTPLSPRPGGWWVVDRPVPAGAWQFVYRVDGQPRVPPAAQRWVPDGFGGTNGVLIVE